MNGQEFATAVQYDLPIIVIVVDNGMYGTIRMHQERDYPGRVSARSSRTRFRGVCEGFRRPRRARRAHRRVRAGVRARAGIRQAVDPPLHPRSARDLGRQGFCAGGEGVADVGRPPRRYHRSRRGRRDQRHRGAARGASRHADRRRRARWRTGGELRQCRLALLAFGDPAGRAGHLEEGAGLSVGPARPARDPLVLLAEGAALADQVSALGLDRGAGREDGVCAARPAEGRAAAAQEARGRSGRARIGRAQRRDARLPVARQFRQRSRLAPAQEGRRRMDGAERRRDASARAGSASALHLWRGGGRGRPLPRSRRLRCGAGPACAGERRQARARQGDRSEAYQATSSSPFSPRPARFLAMPRWSRPARIQNGSPHRSAIPCRSKPSAAITS